MNNVYHIRTTCVTPSCGQNLAFRKATEVYRRPLHIQAVCVAQLLPVRHVWPFVFFFFFPLHYSIFVLAIKKIKSTLRDLLSLRFRFYSLYYNFLFRIIMNLRIFFQFHPQQIFSSLRFDSHSFDYYLFYFRWFLKLFFFTILSFLSFLFLSNLIIFFIATSSF